MRACPRCGRENPDDARFCNACAEPLTSEAVASGDAVRAAMRRDRAEEPDPASPLDPPGEPGHDGVYVRWEGFPFSPLRTVEQTYGQFVFTSVLFFALVAVIFLAFIGQGQLVAGGLFTLIMVALWFISWRVGLG